MLNTSRKYRIARFRIGQSCGSRIILTRDTRLVQQKINRGNAFLVIGDHCPDQLRQVVDAFAIEPFQGSVEPVPAMQHAAGFNCKKRPGGKSSALCFRNSGQIRNLSPMPENLLESHPCGTNGCAAPKHSRGKPHARETGIN